MSKARKCEWCGGDIGAKEIRVKLPVAWDGPAMTYHADCYCRVYNRRCLRAIIDDDGRGAIGPHLRALLDALDPTKDDDE